MPLALLLGAGLSPRVRGNRARAGTERQELGSIPACAGEPCPFQRVARGRWVYPRVCGGTPQRRKYRRRLQGLSPRVRGNPWPARWQAMVYWSIPACAGEPSPPPGQSQLPSVYPRVCGGTGGCGTGDCVPVGLSPRVRGNPSAAPPPSASPGSIPACAGEPAAQNLHRPEARVYPRVCGGTPHPSPPAPQQPGLSPRVRGNPQVLHRNILRLRSIPACAEEPRTPWRRKRWARVYPRVCGGTCWRRRRQ